jgi:hypothetical protein
MEERERRYLDPYTLDRAIGLEDRGLAPWTPEKRQPTPLIPPPAPRSPISPSAKRQGSGKKPSPSPQTQPGPKPEPSPPPKPERSPDAPPHNSLTITPEEDYINVAAAKIADLVYFRREKESLSPSDEMLAELILLTFRKMDPELGRRTMPKFLHTATIRNPEVFHRLMRLTRYDGLGRYLLDRDVSLEEMQSHWEFTWDDVSQLLLGIAAGALATAGLFAAGGLIIKFAIAAVGAVAALLGARMALLFAWVGLSSVPAEEAKKVFDKVAEPFALALHAIRHPLLFRAEKQKEFEDLLLNNQMFEAGTVLGELSVNAWCVLSPLKDLATYTLQYALRFPQVSRAILQAEFAKLWLQIRLRDFSQFSQAGLDILKLPENRIILRSAAVGVVETTANTMEAAAKDLQAAAEKQAAESEAKVRGLVGSEAGEKEAMSSAVNRSTEPRSAEPPPLPPPKPESVQPAEPSAAKTSAPKSEMPAPSAKRSTAKAAKAKSSPSEAEASEPADASAKGAKPKTKQAPRGKKAAGPDGARGKAAKPKTQQRGTEDSALTGPLERGLETKPKPKTRGKDPADMGDARGRGIESEIDAAFKKLTVSGKMPPEWKNAVKQSPPLRRMLLEASHARLEPVNAGSKPLQYQIQTMGSDLELHVKIGRTWYKLDGVIVNEGGSFIAESKFTYIDAWVEGGRAAWFKKNPLRPPEENPYSVMKSFHVEGKGGSTNSAHFGFLDRKVIPQFTKYSELAKRFGFQGVEVVANTDFLWQMFREAAEHLDNVEVNYEELKLGSGSEPVKDTAWDLGAGNPIQK